MNKQPVKTEKKRKVQGTAYCPCGKRVSVNLVECFECAQKKEANAR